MNFLHYDLQLTERDQVIVTLDKQANVQLLDDMNFNSYRNGQAFRYYGGLAKKSPIRLSPPHAGRWHVVIDLGGYAGTVQATVNVEKG
jgi:hypothetical protein